jgi:glycosyltransferase involved in cell wall biosynthesis
MGNVAAFLWARREAKPVVVVQHTHIEILPYRNPILRLVIKAANGLVGRYILRNASQVVFISKTTEKYWKSKIQFRQPPEIIFNGVDTTIYHPASLEERERIRTELRWPAERPVLLFVGRFIEKKGLEIVRRLAIAHPKAIFVLAGWGPINPQSWELPNVQVESNRSGASLASLYQAADLLLLPSLGEGFPLVIQEAMACGLAVMCTDQTATADPSLNHLVVTAPVLDGDPGGTTTQWSSKLTEAIDNLDALRANAGTRTEYAHRHWAWSQAAKLYGDLMVTLVDRQRL